MLATLLQVPRKTFRCLQQCCKSHEKLFGVCNTVAKSHEKLSGVCNTVASPTKNFLAFATPLQVPRKTFWRLQHRCKHFQKRFGYRNSLLTLFLRRTPRCVDEQKAREGAVLMRSPCQRPLPGGAKSKLLLYLPPQKEKTTVP